MLLEREHEHEQQSQAEPSKASLSLARQGESEIKEGRRQLALEAARRSKRPPSPLCPPAQTASRVVFFRRRVKRPQATISLASSNQFHAWVATGQRVQQVIASSSFSTTSSKFPRLAPPCPDPPTQRIRRRQANKQCGSATACPAPRSRPACRPCSCSCSSCFPRRQAAVPSRVWPSAARSVSHPPACGCPATARTDRPEVVCQPRSRARRSGLSRTARNPDSMGRASGWLGPPSALRIAASWHEWL